MAKNEVIQFQAVALGLGSVPVGAFDDEAVKKVCSMPKGCEPLYIIPVGHSVRWGKDEVIFMVKHFYYSFSNLGKVS